MRKTTFQFQTASKTWISIQKAGCVYCIARGLKKQKYWASELYQEGHYLVCKRHHRMTKNVVLEDLKAH